MSKGVYLISVAATVGVVAGAYCLYHFYKEAKKPKIPTTWKEVGTLKDICMYPVKSCGPVRKEKAECTFLGLKDGWLRDRALMIVDDQNNCVTARPIPKLVLIHPSIDNSILTLTCDDIEPLNVDLAEIRALQKPVKATLWGATVKVYDCGWEPSEWLSRLLSKSEKTYKLMLYVSNPKRIYKHFFNNKYTWAETGLFADELPYNLLNEASVNQLNERLNGVKVNYKNFRTNFLLTGAKAYEEDDWKFVKIGENIFQIVKSCNRCVMTTIEPETGIRNTNTEPLKTLKSYRQFTDPRERKFTGSSPRLGLQIKLISGEGGHVSLNDRIYAA